MPIDYKPAEDTFFHPDLFVVCKPIAKKFLDFTPEMVVEILSHANGMKGRNVKFPKQEAEGIPHYILIDAEKNLAESYQLLDYQRQPLDQRKPFDFRLPGCRVQRVFDDSWA